MIKTSVDDFSLFGGKQAFDSFRTTMNLVTPNRDIFFKYAKESFDARHMTNNGPAVRELERELAMFHRVKHCVVFCSGFTAMYITLRCMALTGKTEVVVPSLTYRRSADIVDWAGLLPRFCDIDPKTLAISPETARSCINENTALILAPHPITNLCDIIGMEALAKEYGLPIMFDSVEACGSEYNGKMIGNYGDCEAFSMHASKVINSCEGGYITTNNDEIAEKIRLSRAFGFSSYDRIEILGHNAKLNELHAAMGLASLCEIEQQFAENKQIHLAYQKNLSDLPGVTVIPYDFHEKRNWKSVLVRLDNEWPFSRDDTLKLLNAENIHARTYYSPPLHTVFPRQAGKGQHTLSVVEQMATNHFILPFGSTVSEEDTYIIGQVFRDILALQHQVKEKLSHWVGVNA